MILYTEKHGTSLNDNSFRMSTVPRGGDDHLDFSKRIQKSCGGVHDL